MLSSFIFLLLIGAKSIFTESLAEAQDSNKSSYCVGVFQKINDEIRFGYVSPKTRERVTQYLNDKKVPAKDRAKKIFYEVISDRIKLLPKKEGQIVKNFLLDHVVLDHQESGSPVFAGFFDESHYGKKEIIISIPIDLSDTIIEYTLLTHELEHYIQSLAISHSPMGIDKSSIESVTHFVDFKYEKEVGAMLSEFEYLNVIPPENRNQLAQSIKENPSLFDEDTTQFLQSILNFHGTTPMEYVKKQHAIGRYDRESIRLSQYQQFFIGGLILASGPSDSIATLNIKKVLLQTQQACDRLSESENSDSKPVYNKKDLLRLCQKNY